MEKSFKVSKLVLDTSVLMEYIVRRLPTGG